MGETTISRLVDKVNELSDSGKQLRDQLAAKDREIAELIAQLDSARQDGEAAERFRATYLREREEARNEVAELRRQLETWRAAEFAAINKGEAIKRERDEARECVKRLCETLTAIRDSTCTSATTLRGHAGVALAATPEHLRG